jgi:hypothetical protein
MSAIFRRVLPSAVIVLGIAITAAWTLILGYGLVTLAAAL